MFVLMFQALGERMLVIIKENEAIMTEVLSLSFCTLKTFISLKFE